MVTAPIDNVLLQIDGLTTAVKTLQTRNQELEVENADLRSRLATAATPEKLAEVAGKVQALADSISSPSAD